jgi:hypothetical protein
MPNIKPFFLTGANAKIIVNGVTLALATDVAYTIRVNHASPKILGMYEVQEHQPLSYDVLGSFSIIRYIAGVNSSSERPSNVTSDGNSIGNWRRNTGNAIADTLGLPDSRGNIDAKAQESFIPERMFQSMMFDMEIRQKTPNGECVVARFRNCRITQSDFRVGMKSVAQQQFGFKAQYVDEDGFIARKSGAGQELS